MFNNSNGYSLSDIAAVANNDGFGFGGGGAWWIILLFLFGFGGWGNGGFFGGNNGVVPAMVNNDVQRGFDQSAIINGIAGLNTAVSNGFANAEISRCNGQANILQALNANQAANTQNLNTLGIGVQGGFNGVQAGLADLKYTVATENCADRTVVNEGLRDIIANQTANTQALLNNQTQGIQAILDKLCETEIENLKSRNQQLEMQAYMSNLAVSQTAQTGALIADNQAQTNRILDSLNPAPVPAYIVSNPNGCGCNTGCGCGYYG